MPNISDWIAELTEKRQREEQAAKEAAKIHHRRIEEIDASIAQLQRTAEILEENGSPGQVLGQADRVSATPRPAAPPMTHTYWKWAELAYRDVGHPMRMPALSRAVQKIGGPDISRESLRTILRGKPGIFEYRQAGYYALSEWPEEIKDKKPEGA